MDRPLVDDAVARFFAAAAGRPAWMLWGKARPADDTQVPAHPLLAHMVDVAVVGEILVDEVLAGSTVSRLWRGLGLSETEGRGWLPRIIALHDFGKATPPFQGQWEPAHAFLEAANMRVTSSNKPHHGEFGMKFLPDALGRLGIDEDSAGSLARVVCAHHGEFPSDAAAEKDALPATSGATGEWHAARRGVVEEIVRAFPATGIPRVASSGREAWAFQALLAGLVSVADWIGSMAEFFVYEEPVSTLEDYLPRARTRARAALAHAGLHARLPTTQASFEELFHRTPRPLQSLAVKLVSEGEPPLCAIVEAPMGEGKTETAFYVAHALAALGIHDGMYVALPTQATANQMFGRMTAFLRDTRPGKTSAILVHGEASFDTRMRELLRAVYGESETGVVCEGWFLGGKRSLLAPFGAGTIDQALLAVLRTKHAFVRHFGLAGKTIVLDEIHAYDAYTSKLLERLVGWLGAHGASVVLLSATLPASQRNTLLEAYAGRSVRPQSAVAYPRLTYIDGRTCDALPIPSGRPSSSVALRFLEEEAGAGTAGLVGEIAATMADGGCVAVLRNTVARAQATFRALLAARQSGEIPEDTELLLLHARFPGEDRERLEQRLVERLGPGAERRPSRMVVVGTQVLEQSLDVDFDAMFSDIAPVDLLLQRMGRIHRHAGRIRPAPVEDPTLTAIVSAGSPESCKLDEVAVVYEEYLVRRTLQVLAGRTSVALPEDIEPLVEAVYAETPPSDGSLDAAWADLEEVGESQKNLARTRAWPEATQRDDPFGDFPMPLREDDPAIAKMLRAETRLGDPTAAVVCLFGTPERAFLDAACTRPISLAADGPMTPDVVRAFARRTVRVLNFGVVKALERMPPSPLFADVSVLRDRRPLFFGNGPIPLDGWTLDLDPELGLLLEKLSPAKED
jgi:CRISPR-associated endonuclease/helicase Cas3